MHRSNITHATLTMLKLLALICFTFQQPVSCADPDLTQISDTKHPVMPSDLSKSAVTKSLDDLRLRTTAKIELIQKNEMDKLIELGPSYVAESLIVLTDAFSKAVIDMRNQIANVIATYPIDHAKSISDKRIYEMEFWYGVKDKVRALEVCKYRSRIGITPVKLIPMFELYKKAPQFNAELLQKFESYLYSGGYSFVRGMDIYKYGYEINTGLCYLSGFSILF